MVGHPFAAHTKDQTQPARHRPRPRRREAARSRPRLPTHPIAVPARSPRLAAAYLHPPAFGERNVKHGVVVAARGSHPELQFQPLQIRRVPRDQQQIEVLGAPSEPRLDDASPFGPLHGRGMIGRQHARGVPAVLVPESAVDDRLDGAQGRLRPAVAAAAGEHGEVEAHGDRLAQTPVDFLQALPELQVPDVVQLGVMMLAEPPEPVAAFGDQDVAPGRFGSRLSGRLAPAVAPAACEPTRGSEVARVMQEVPGRVVPRVAAPGAQVASDPRTGVEPVERLGGRVLASRYSEMVTQRSPGSAARPS